MGLKYVVKGVSVLNDLNDLENIVVGFKQRAATPAGPITDQAVATGQVSNSERVPVYLRDVATIRFGNKDPENIVTINGQRCVGLSIYKEPKFNTVDAVKSLQKAIATLEKALPGYEFIRVQDQGEFIHNAIGEVKNTLLIGILLAVFILYVFLRRIGTTLVISVAIPISIIATFNLMYFNHLTLNIMTLGGLALGAGMLVDNAIVVLENITRLREEGVPLKEAVIRGTGEVGRCNYFIHSDNNCGFSSNSISAWSLGRNVQGSGMDCCFLPPVFTCGCDACHTDAGLNAFHR